MPASATYGIDPKTQSLIDKNKATTGLTNVRTQQLVELFPEQSRYMKTRNDNLVSQIKDRGVRTQLAGLGYDLDMRKHAAQVAHQNVMASIAQGNLTNAQKNTALREVTLRVKSIIDPTRIIANTGAIIGDLNKALTTKGADVVGIKKQLARMQQIQQQMMEFSKLGTQPDQAISDATTLGRMIGEDMGGLGILGQLGGIPSNAIDARMQMLGGLPMQNPYDDPNMSDDDYYDNQDMYGTSPLSQFGQNYRSFMSGTTGAPAPRSRGVRLNLGP
jgi:hypothetical protein